MPPTTTGSLLLLLLLGCVVLDSSVVWASSPPDIPPDSEVKGLADFYDHFGGKNWKNNSLWNTQNELICRSWYGVHCTADNTGQLHIYQFNLDGNNLEGLFHTFNWDVWPYLQNLFLSNNNISGIIPDNFFLSHLPLSQMLLSDNIIGGTLPTTIGFVKTLQELDFYANQLSGAVPSEIFSLPQLTRLRLGNNNFGGYLTINPVENSLLNYLDLSQNPFSSPFPDNIYQFRALTLLSLASLPNGGMGLSGSLSSQIGNFQSLTFLDLSFNLLTGSIPSEITQLPLFYLSLQNNQLQGTIPTLGWNSLANLQYLSLGNNQLSGSIPTSIFGCSSLVKLDVGVNYLSGTIDPSISNLVNIQTLNLKGNPDPDTPSDSKLSGTVPDGIWSLRKMGFLFLSFNNLYGTINPNVGNVMRDLSTLSMENNNLFAGTIPTSLYTLSKLQFLMIQNNQITGKLTDGLWNLTLLNTLDVSNNNLQGYVPTYFAAKHPFYGVIVDPLAENPFACPLPENAADYYGATCNIPAISLLTNNLFFNGVPMTTGIEGFALCPSLVSFMYCEIAIGHNSSKGRVYIEPDNNLMKCDLPPSKYLSGLATFSLYLDNAFFSSAPSPVLLYGVPTIKDFYPKNAREQGGFGKYNVYVIGTGLVATGSAICKFNNINTTLIVLNSTFGYCNIPAYPVRPLHDNQTVSFNIANDLTYFNIEINHFEYYPWCDGDPVCGGERQGHCNASEPGGVHPFCECEEGFAVNYSCFECLPNYYGSECSECQICENGGRCIDGYNGNGDCSCAWGFGFEHCWFHWAKYIGIPALAIVGLLVIIAVTCVIRHTCKA